MFCAAFLSKKLIYQILTSKLAPSLVYHGLIRALLSLAFAGIFYCSNIFIFPQNISQSLFLEILKFSQEYSKKYIFLRVTIFQKFFSLWMFPILTQVLKNLNHSLRCSEKYVHHFEIAVLHFFSDSCVVKVLRKCM